MVFVVVAIVYTSYCLLESALSVRLSVSGLVLGSSSFIDPTLWTTLMLRMCMKRWFTTSLLYLMPFLFATNLQFFLDLDEIVWAFDFSLCVCIKINKCICTYVCICVFCLFLIVDLLYITLFLFGLIFPFKAGKQTGRRTNRPDRQTDRQSAS